MEKVLVTGAGGYIGSVATYLLLNKGYSVIGFDNFSTGYREVLEFFKQRFPSQFKYYEGDLRKEVDFVFEKEKIDAVLHYAAACKVDESMKNPGHYFENNVVGSLNLLKSMHKHGVGKIVFSSTCAVYGEAQYVPVDENHPTMPSNPYGMSKRIVEQMLEWYNKVHGLNYVILRYFNVCGASDDGLVGDSKRPSVLLMQNAVRGALGLEPFSLTCPKVDTPDGTPIRDYINVADLNEAHIAALEHLSRGGKSEIINLGTGKGNSVLEIVDAVKKITNAEFKMGAVAPRQGEYAKMIASTEKSQILLGWRAKRGISESVKSLVKWYSGRRNGWLN